ncbi:hamartin [Drosophila albomicans]|uniref:Hamartin n=1 Tax=Drosophila albomicans TaxID=7291 RepID=A0A6P8XKY2_DROAB|nr:hamartin [Drosophila albomicans]
MDIERLFNDLESNQTHDNEEAKKKLVELFAQTKEQWPVRYMLDYYIKTGSQRIMEVLVKAQAPHDGYIFDRLDDWLKQQQHRVQALNVFCFIVRRHPTWLHKIEKHRLIKSVFKLLTHEKDIVPLMCALLCIITLLPIIPNSVPNFLNDLFEVFGHLASWKLQNVNRLPDDKLVHLQLGLQMLFHRLYGMYPCNFLSYLSNFIKKDNGGGGIFQHTIKPLLDTVRVHPMLLTGTTETETSNTRWKEMEPHDVVMECAHLSLPVLHPDSSIEDINSAYPGGGTPSYSRMTSATSNSDYYNNGSGSGSYQLRQLQQTSGAIKRFEAAAYESSQTPIWSPHTEIAAAAASSSTAIPLTPTAAFILPQQPTSSNSQLLGVTGSSPPEAAVEATPETTPLKDLREFKQQQQQQLPNSHAVRAIFASSQPSSPLRKEQQSQFPFPDISTAPEEVLDQFQRVPLTNYQRRLQQVKLDRHNTQQAEQVPEEALLTATLCTTTGPVLTLETKEQLLRSNVCGECNETERNRCSDGGLHMPTRSSMQQLAKGVKRRNRMASYCCNEESWTSSSGSGSGSSSTAAKKATLQSAQAENQMRRSKSCSALPDEDDVDDETDSPKASNGNGAGCSLLHHLSNQKTVVQTGSRLQRSGRVMTMTAPLKATTTTTAVVASVANAGTQTLEVLPPHYEDSLYELLFECKEQRNKYERSQLYPQDILDQFITRCIHNKDNGLDLTVNAQQEQCQLMCLQLQYESYRRGIHAERNRRLMGRSRDKRSLEMERDRLREQLKNFDAKNRDLAHKMDTDTRRANERQISYNEELAALLGKYQHELEQKQCLRQANEDLQTRLNAEMQQREELRRERDSLRGQLFSMSTELLRAQQEAEVGLQCKQELARLETEFIIMGEVQVRCRDRLAEIDNYRARDEELQMLQESYNAELKELRHNLDEKTHLLESTRHKIAEQQAQLLNSEKVITEQKRLLRTVKDEYDEMFKSVNKKYDIQKKIIVQMEEKLMMSLQQPQSAMGHTTCSPDTDRTDIASSMERNSPLSTSLASSESLSASLRSTELKNLQQLLETPSIPEVPSMATGTATNIMYEDNPRLPAIDLASSAGTASAINIMQMVATAEELDLPSTSNHSHAPHPHLHLQQEQPTQSQQQQQQ